MHVNAVADQLGDDLVGSSTAPASPGRAMRQRRHPIEEMRRVPRAGANACQRLLVGRAGMPERHAMAVRDEIANEVERAVELRRHRDDADVGSRGSDFVEDLRRPRDTSAGLGARSRSRRRQPQALERLRAPVVRD